MPASDREYNRRKVEIFRRQHKGQVPPKHGVSGYQNYGCRCEVCRKAVCNRKG